MRRNKDATGTKAGTKENKESLPSQGFYTGKLFYMVSSKYFPGRRYALIADSAFQRICQGKSSVRQVVFRSELLNNFCNLRVINMIYRRKRWCAIW